MPHLHKLPALQWKLKNIQQMSDHKRETALQTLQGILSAGR